MAQLTVAFVAKAVASLILLSSTLVWVQDNEGNNAPTLDNMRPNGATATQWSAADLKIKALAMP